MAQAPTTDVLAEGPPAVGAKLQALRQARKLSLDELSKLAGVSKSMLSQVERNLANPTVVVLWRLATALLVVEYAQ
jgi:transcriptional regulator with XRE-family HTH domain